MQQVWITIFLCSMVATYESNENGQFSTQLGLAKVRVWRVNRKCCFSWKEHYFEEKNTVCLYSCWGLAISKRGVKLSFQALLRKFDFV